MRVLQLGPYPPPHGGVQTNLVGIRRSLLERRIPCAVINLTRFRRANVDGVHYPRNAVEVVRLLMRLRYDIVHLHIGGLLSRRLLGLALVCSLLPRTRTVLTFHSGGYPASDGGRTAAWATLRGFVLRRFHRIIAVNQEIVHLMRRFGVAPARLRLISPHGVDPEPLADELSEPFRTFFATHRPVLATVGLLEPEYDVPLQIVALGLVRESFPEVGLVVIGAGSLEATLRAKMAAAPDADDVLICGDVPHSTTLRVVQQADLFLRTTRYDGDSISVREALHLGTPVIATDTGTRPDGVDLIPPADLPALQRAIERRLREPAVRRRRPGAGERNVEAVLRLYEELAAKVRR